MGKSLSMLCLVFSLAVSASAADIQGVIADWNCVPAMVRDGREKTFKSRRSCSLMKNTNRSAYGLITVDNKYYRLEDPGNAKIRQLLKDTPAKDDLHVVVSGELEGNVLKVKNISML